MAGQEIRINYAAVDKAIGKIDQKIQIINEQKALLAKTEIASAQSSTGPCAETLKSLAAAELPRALNTIVSLMENSKTFLTSMKSTWQDTDTNLAK